jgi:histidyl-tRNA synthetase
MAGFKTIKGFRDFFPEDCILRNYIQDTWRSIAHRYGFWEYEGPVLESTDLYRKKSGEEIVSQLFHFLDNGDREVALRPEVTPTLARMATARQRHYSKPLKWFQIGSCFRYEEPQEGRKREFIQFNADILGEGSVGADAELVAMAIDVMLEFGFAEGDFTIRLSNRQIWSTFLAERSIAPEKTGQFLQIIDKIERAKIEETSQKLDALGLSYGDVRSFMDTANGDHPAFAQLRANLTARGLWKYVRIDASIVRGLAYYTGAVFEVFDLKHGLRAVAGGGRYDELCKLMSDGAVDMPAAGYAMGDVVLGLLLEKTPGAQMKLLRYTQTHSAAQVYVISTDEGAQTHALAAVQRLRQVGLRVEHSLSLTKIGKQFQAAENTKARCAIIFGQEYPEVAVKDLANRQQVMVQVTGLLAHVQELLTTPELGPLIA